MIRVCQCKCGKHARNYYTRSDYYLDRQELAGRWGGSAIIRLGLREGDEVSKQPFDLLCENRHPLTGERLTLRTKDKRTPGYDINFHVSKSVSLLYALTGDSDILAAFRWSVDQTMRSMEARMLTRVRTGGQCFDRHAGNMGWASFVHLTARPVAGVPDPHLHAHCFCFNAVFDPVERRWKAGQFRQVKQEAPRFQAMFRQLLSRRLSDLGYATVWQGEDFEIAGISRELIDKFSRRHQHIEAEATRRNILTDALKDSLAGQTRERKRHDLSMPELRRIWWQRLTDDERNQIARADLHKRQPWPGDARRQAPLPDSRHPHGDLLHRRRQAAYARSRMAAVATLPSNRQAIATHGPARASGQKATDPTNQRSAGYGR